MAHVLDGGSLERRPLLYTQLAYNPSYGGIIGISESIRSEASAENSDCSDEPELFLSASESHFDYQEAQPSGRSREMLQSDLFLTVSEGLDYQNVPRELPDGQDSAPPGGDPAPEPCGSPFGTCR